MKKNNEFWTEMGKPFVVLLVICLVSAALLGALHSVTAPIIEENARLKAEETRKSVLPEADAFEPVPVPEGSPVSEIYKAANGAGYVVTAVRYGYHGDVTVTVGFGPDGEIVALSADVSTETSGVGSKAGGSDYLDRFVGLSGSVASVDTLSGATYSSTAVRTAVQDAMDALASVK